jgi:phage terminase large subunit
MTELVNRKSKSLDKKGRRVVESKDDYKARGFRSPDDADAFLLAFYNPYGSVRPRLERV